jgi:pSer/pThr/pTyr-binding forkhead associated (FHA) protein
MVVRFHVVLPAANQRTLAVRLPILLGRGEEAKFRIQHHLVSRRHCEFFEHAGHLYVRDLGSTNGTFLDGRQVSPSTQTVVVPGATVRVGGLSFTVDYRPTTAEDSTGVINAQRAPETVAVEESREENSIEGDSGAGHEQPEQEHAEQEQVDFKLAHTDEVMASPDEVEREPGETSALDEPSQPVEGFDFLNGGDAATQPSGIPEWPSPADAAADEPPDDDQLNAFFKGLN